MKKSLFNSESDRELWIKLNAEQQIEWEKGLTYFDVKTQTHKPTLQALNFRSMEEAGSRISIGYTNPIYQVCFTIKFTLIIANVAGKIIGSVKIELDYAKLIGTKPNITFLEYENN